MRTLLIWVNFITILSLFFCVNLINAQNTFVNNQLDLVNELNDDVNLKEKSSTFSSFYTDSKCGLNYSVKSFLTGERMYPVLNDFDNLVQSFQVVFEIPQNAEIEKVYAFWEIAGVTDTSSFILMDLLGNINHIDGVNYSSSEDLYWQFGGTSDFYADITSLISGRDTFQLSGLPTTESSQAGIDATGISFITIYTDNSQSFIGTLDFSIGGMTVKGDSLTTEIPISEVDDTTEITAFMLVHDLQNLGSTIMFNDGAYFSVDEDFVDFEENESVIVPGQNSMLYGIKSLNDGCKLSLAGMYYQTEQDFEAVVVSEDNGNLYCNYTDALNYQWYVNDILIPNANYSYYNPEYTANYKVEITTQAGCVLWSTEYNYVNSIEEVKAFNGKVYPNPVKSKLFIEELEKGSIVKIYDISGNCVKTLIVETSNEIIDFSKYQSGVHVLLIETKINLEYFRFVKN